LAHTYYLPIRVWHKQHVPYALLWRGVRYRVLLVNEPWRLQDRWWVSAAEADANGGRGYSDRTYYRLCCKAAGADWDLWCDIYYDAAVNVWILERVID
jgi:Domain of unknown function (DUF6504)